MTTTLYYVHDPMCSWCWGFRPVWDAVKAGLPKEIHMENVVGGLAKDTDEPMPELMQNKLQGVWRQVQQQLGTEFNFDFWSNNQPRRATFMACRAVVTAKGLDFEVPMIHAIQQAYYLQAKNPSDIDVLVTLANETAKRMGIAVSGFGELLQSKEVITEFDRQLKLARTLPIRGFPSLVLEHQGNLTLLAQSYTDSQAILDEVQALTGQN